GVAPFSAISGRKNEYLKSPTGEILVGINYFPRGFDKLGPMQIVQDAPDHIDILVETTAEKTPEIEAQMLERARAKIPGTMKVDIKFVDALQRTAIGKTPFIIRRI